MNPPRIPTFLVALAVAALLGPAARATDPWPAPRPIAAEIPAFQAPPEPPDGKPEPPPIVEPEGALTLEHALALALMGNPALAEFSWAARAGEARVLQAGKWQNPSLDLRLWVLDAERNQPERTRRRVILSQVFEMGHKRRNRLRLAKIEQNLAGLEYEERRIQTATIVAGHFVTVLGAQRRVASARRQVELLEETRAKVAAFVESGSVRSVEVHEVARRAGMAQIDLQRVESELSSARFRLAATWGSRSPRFTEAAGDLEQVAPVPDLDTVMSLAEGSPVMTRWNTELERSNAEIAVAKSNAVADFQFGVGARWESLDGPTDYLLDFEIDLPLADRKQGDIREARYNLARAEAGQRAAAAASTTAIADLYYRLSEADQRRSTLRDQVVPAARSSFEVFRLAFDELAGDVDDLVDACRDLTRAEIDYSEALVDYHRTLATLEGILGQSLPLAP